MFSLIGFLIFSIAFGQEKAQVVQVTPQGYVKSVEQIHIKFSHPMVRFGDIKIEFPAQSSCFKNGQGRWVDTKNWVFDFNAPIPGGTQCSIQVFGQNYSFNTGGPQIKETFPRPYRPVDPDQAFVLMLDAPVNKDSLKTGAYFVVEGLGDKIPVTILDDSEAKKIREAAEKEYKYEKESFSGESVVIKAQRTFPSGAKVSLVWGRNVQSSSGGQSPNDQVLEFSVLEPFKVTFNCDREATGAPCIPLLNMYLSFSSSVMVKDAKHIYLEDSSKKRIYLDNSQGTEENLKSSWMSFKGPFAPKTEYLLHIPKDLKDEDGRRLSNINQFPLKIKTGENPALLKFSAQFGVIEADAESAMAVTLRRVEPKIETKFLGWTGKFDAANFKSILSVLNEIQQNPYGEKRLSPLEKASIQKIQIQKKLSAQETEVVGIPLKKSGFYVVEMESPLLGQALLDRKASFYVRSAALVTKMAVHLKYSSREALVWVTDLKSAGVLQDVDVKLYDVLGQEIARGKTNEKGLALISFKKPLEELPRREGSEFYDGFFAVAEKGEDFSFTYSGWKNGIEPWRFQLGGYVEEQPFIGHAVLDRTLFRPEEVLSAKIFLRKSKGVKLELPSESQWPTTVELNHATGLQSFKLPLKWNKSSGTAFIKFNLPGGIKMGSWHISLVNEKIKMNLDVGEFAVESFRIPLVQMRMTAGTPDFVMEKNIPIGISGNYFSGGVAGQLPVKMRWSVEPNSFYPQDENLADFVFGNGAVREGIFRSGEDEGTRYIPQSGTQDFKLDQLGAYQSDLKNLKYAAGPQKLRVELEFKDPNGEIQSAIRSFNMWPSSILVGIKSKSWTATPDRVEFDVVALNLLQQPIKNQRVKVELYKSQYYSHRKRLVGGFYSYEDFREYRKIGELCQGSTNAQGLFNCTGAVSTNGSVLAVVSTSDAKGLVSSANVNQWIVAKGENHWFGSTDDDRVDFIPFRKTYEPGEVAEFQLRTPFAKSKVLVTVERDSVLHSEIVEVSGDRPIIRLPIKKEYAPNVVVSAFAIRGRLNDPKPTALVDLGKPAFKLGMSQIKVGWKENKLKVEVSTDKKKYKVREKSLVTVRVVKPNGDPAANAEIALVAVDEGLLELRDNRSWDLLRAMMVDRPHAVSTATAQTLLTGRRHFGLKALPIGGDGAGGLRRELFDTLLYWNPAIKLNSQGIAKIEVPLNDATTSFRVVAIAQNGSDQFGTGWTSIQSTQDVMILSGLAGMAREGDKFHAGFTIRNASSEVQDLEVSLRTVPATTSLSTKKIKLDIGESEEVFWQMVAPDPGALEYYVVAKNSQGQIVDQIKKTQKVLALRSPRIYQSEWGGWPDFKKIRLQQPVDANLKKSSVLVEVNEGLGGSEAGIKEFWKNYGYSCLEQEVSRAVSLQDKKIWSRIDEKLTTYLDPNGLLKYFPSSYSKGSVNLTAYVLSIAHEAGLKLSAENEERLLSSLDSFSKGKFKEEDEQNRADSSLKKITVFEALSRYRRLNIDLLTSVEYMPEQWPLYSLLEWYQIHLWEKNIPSRQEKLAEIEKSLRSRFYFSAKRLQINDEGREQMPWLMRDSTSAVIKLILAKISDAGWRDDIPRLYQGLLSRQAEGSWSLTSNNAWGAIVIKKMKSYFAAEKVQGSFIVSMDKKVNTHLWQNGPQKLFELPWDQRTTELSWAQQGVGRPWVTVSAKIDVPVTKPTFAGFTIEKKIIPVEQRKKNVWSVGDIAKVQLKVKPKVPQTWVVIEDPVPAGASVIQSSWATAVERKEDLVRYYFSWFAGDEVIEYNVRFNQPGQYRLPISRVEAMYSPDLFAELPESKWTVVE